MPASLERLQKVSDTHAKSRQSLITELLKLLLGFWGDFDGWYDPTLVAGQSARSADLVAAATAKARRLARSYTQTVLSDMGGWPTKPPVQVDFYPRNGVGALDVYSRPATQFVYARSQGATVEDARKVAFDRLTALATQDVKLATRDEQRRLYMGSPKVIGYRRIIHPELSETGTCGLCVVASSRIYSTDELMPLHGPSCNCDTMPITAGDDPGLRINQDDLDRIYEAAGGNAAEDLVNTRITINEHGELGPVLWKQGDNFKTAKESGRPAFKKPTRDNIRADMQRALEGAEKRLADAQAAYDLFASQTGAMEPNTRLNDQRVKLFRAQKALAEHVAALKSALANLPK
jgi:hypothetical protein